MQIENFSDFINALKRRKYTALLTFFLIFIISVATAILIPPVYRSTATILIEQQDIPEDLVRSTITSFADQRIQVISQRVMTRSNLLHIINKYDLYPDEREKEAIEVVIEDMKEDIRRHMISADVIDPRSGRPTVATIAFSLSFVYEHPGLAQKVANELTTLYLNENLKERTEAVVETSSFIEEEVRKISQHISLLERKLAVFKEENNGRLPEQADFNLTILDRAQQQILEVDSEIRFLKERKIYLAAELSQISPHSNLYGESGERILTSVDRLKALETKYISLSAIYSEHHPDIKRLQRELDVLRNDVRNEGFSDAVLDTRQDLEAKLKQLRQKHQVELKAYTANHPNVVRIEEEISRTENLLRVKNMEVPEKGRWTSSPDNPAYIQIKAQLDATDMELIELERKQRELNSKIEGLELKITHLPNIEKEYKELTRDYENSWVRYKELKAKQMEAQLAETLESERKAERFNLIEPPLLPEKPIKPNRIAILILGFIFSVGAAMGAVVLRDIADKSVRGAKGINLALELEPLVTIPYIVTISEARRAKVKAVLVGASVIALVGAISVSIHMLYMPLDVLWFKGLRKLDL